MTPVEQAEEVPVQEEAREHVQTEQRDQTPETEAAAPRQQQEAVEEAVDGREAQVKSLMLKQNSKHLKNHDLLLWH